MMAGEGTNPTTTRFGDLVALKGVVKYSRSGSSAPRARLGSSLQEALQDPGEATSAQPHTAG
jgi:hypothetical protein